MVESQEYEVRSTEWGVIGNGGEGPGTGQAERKEYEVRGAE
jgi:hypothetical protein